MSCGRACFASRVAGVVRHRHASAGGVDRRLFTGPTAGVAVSWAWRALRVMAHRERIGTRELGLRVGRGQLRALG